MRREKKEYAVVFGQRIKEIRGKETQLQFAKRLGPVFECPDGLSLDTIRSWEQGYSIPDIKSLLKLCDFFGCDLDYLLGRIDKKTHDLQFICDQTGLSAAAVNKLRSFKGEDFQAAAYNSLRAVEFLILSRRFPGLGRCIHHALELNRNSSEPKVAENLERLNRQGVTAEDLIRAEKLIRDTGDMIMSMNEAAVHYAQQSAFILQSMITDRFEN